MDGYIPPQNPAEISAVDIGDTVFNGDKLLAVVKFVKFL